MSAGELGDGARVVLRRGGRHLVVVVGDPFVVADGRRRVQVRYADGCDTFADVGELDAVDAVQLDVFGGEVPVVVPAPAPRGVAHEQLSWELGGTPNAGQLSMGGES